MTAPKPRLYFLDNLKVLLAVLVVLHHAGQPYGPGGAWWIPSEPEQFVTLLVLGIFFSVNASFFMGLFFFISSYFLPGSYDRKGPARFMKERLVRLGVPIMVFTLAIFPAMVYLLYAGGQSLADFYFNSYLDIGSSKSTLSAGHLWFLVLLLAFSACYVGWRVMAKRQVTPEKKPEFPGLPAIAAFVAAITLLTFVAQIWSPINSWVPFRLFEPAHLPQYALLFAGGIVAYRRGWLDSIPKSAARLWSIMAAAMVVAFPVIYVVWEDALIEGGFTLPSLVHSTWEALMCVSMCIALLAFFKNRFNSQGRLAKALADNAFTAYLIHIPVIVFLQYLLQSVEIHPLLKFAAVAAVGVPLTFAISHFIVRKLPYAKNILG
jgi:peptidoglycan/LPS O-acetylase OafA/YrhL